MQQGIRAAAPEAGYRYSFVMLTYNQAGLVAEAVRGALAQECAPLEIVFSDDCSSDGTFEVIRQAVAGYAGPHRIVLNQNATNLGLAGHIARVHDLASGDVLIAAAGDDVSLPHRSRRIMETFAAQAPLLVCSYAVVVDVTGAPAVADYRDATLYATDDLTRVARSTALYLGATGAWHRSLFTRYGPMESAAYEDLVLGFRAALERRVAVIPEELVVYRLGHGITSSERMPIDPVAYRTQRKRQVAAWHAVMRQRVTDAATFGLEPQSSVWAALRKAETKARLILAYQEEDLQTFLRRAVRHPLLVPRIIRGERRRRRKALLQSS